jgi:hypothetical protein
MGQIECSIEFIFLISFNVSSAARIKPLGTFYTLLQSRQHPAGAVKTFQKFLESLGNLSRVSA